MNNGSNGTQSGDRELICTDCDDSFVFTVRDQEFFKQQGFQDPRRCKPCRNRRKAMKNGGNADQQNFNSEQKQNFNSNGDNNDSRVWEDSFDGNRRRR